MHYTGEAQQVEYYFRNSSIRVAVFQKKALIRALTLTLNIYGVLRAKYKVIGKYTRQACVTGKNLLGCMHLFLDASLHLAVYGMWGALAGVGHTARSVKSHTAGDFLFCCVLFLHLGIIPCFKKMGYTFYCSRAAARHNPCRKDCTLARACLRACVNAEKPPRALVEAVSCNISYKRGIKRKKTPRKTERTPSPACAKWETIPAPRPLLCLVAPLYVGSHAKVFLLLSKQQQSLSSFGINSLFLLFPRQRRKQQQTKKQVTQTTKGPNVCCWIGKKKSKRDNRTKKQKKTPL